MISPVQPSFRPAAFSLFLALGLSGCTHYQAKPLRPAETAAQLDARSLSDPLLRGFVETNLHRAFLQWPPASWDLETLTLIAFYYHPDLAVARADWDVAEAGIKTAGGRPNPTLTLTPGYDTTHNLGISPWFPSVSFDLPIETAGKRGHRIAVARHLSESARWNVATVAWQVRSRLRASLLDEVVARRRVSLLEQERTVQQQIVRQLEQRLAVGEISHMELTTARIALNKTQIDLDDATSRSTEARAQLAESLGVGLHALEGMEFAFDLTTDAPEGWTSTEARRAALLGRADILGGLAEYAATEETLRLEIARQYPDVHLNPGYQFDQGDNKWSLGITVELPVLNQNQGPIAEAEARRRAAAARFTALQAKVIGEIDRAVAGYTAARGQLTATVALLAAEQQQEQSVEAQVRAGAMEPLDLFNAKLETGTAALAQLDGQVRTQQAVARLEDAVQRPLEGWPSLERNGAQQAKEEKP